MLSKVIAIDGPSASGKGTLASNIARELGWATLDSGSIYRAIGLLAGRLGLLDQESELVLKLRDFDLRFENGSCFLAGEDLTQEIRTEEVGKMASAIASFPSLRETVLSLQKKKHFV